MTDKFSGLQVGSKLDLENLLQLKVEDYVNDYFADDYFVYFLDDRKDRDALVLVENMQNKEFRTVYTVDQEDDFRIKEIEIFHYEM